MEKDKWLKIQRAIEFERALSRAYERSRKPSITARRRAAWEAQRALVRALCAGQTALPAALTALPSRRTPA